MLNQSEKTTTTTNTPIPGVKRELPKKNRLPAILGIAVIGIVAIAGIGISLRQFFIRDTVAPTAPSESQANIDKVQDCSVSFDVAPPESGISCIKRAYQDELSNTAGEYELLQMETDFAPGDIVVYSFLVTNTGERATTITATDTLTTNVSDDVIFDFEFLDSNCGTNAFQNRTLTCTTDELEPGESQTFTFRIKLSELIDTDLTVNNMVEITDGTTNNSCSIGVNVDVPTEAYCNEGCSTNNDCVEDSHSCIEGVCRLTSNPDSVTCTEATCNESCSATTDCVEDNHSCIEGVCRLTDNPKSVTCEEAPSYCGEPCQTTSDCAESDHICYQNECRLADNPTDINCRPEQQPTPTPDTEAYCGEYCSTNADCVQGDHICYFNQCRLADYPDRTDCKAPQATTTVTYVEPTPAVGCNENCLSNRDCSNNDHICYEGKCRLADYPGSTSCTVPQNPSQPKMPEELPQSGSDDLINWIKAGIGILGAGALLLLL